MNVFLLFEKGYMTLPNQKNYISAGYASVLSLYKFITKTKL